MSDEANLTDQVTNNANSIVQMQASMAANHQQLLDMLSGHQAAAPTSPAVEGEPVLKRPKLEWSETLAQVWEKTPTEAGIKAEGNRKRFESLWALREHVVKLESLVNIDPANVDPAAVSESLLDLKIALADQLHMVRLADRSPAGWAHVDAYRADNLALNPEDERRIQRSGTTAVKQKSSRHSGGWKQRQVANSTSLPSLVATNYTQPFHAQGRTAGPYRPFYSANRASKNPNAGCHICGDSSHWKDTCPQASAKK